MSYHLWMLGILICRRLGQRNERLQRPGGCGGTWLQAGPPFLLTRKGVTGTPVEMTSLWGLRGARGGRWEWHWAWLEVGERMGVGCAAWRIEASTCRGWKCFWRITHNLKINNPLFHIQYYFLAIINLTLPTHPRREWRRLEDYECLCCPEGLLLHNKWKQRIKNLNTTKECFRQINTYLQCLMLAFQRTWGLECRCWVHFRPHIFGGWRRFLLFHN